MDRAEALWNELGKPEWKLHIIAAHLAAAESSALERAAQVAKQSQEDCFCKDKSDELTGGMPCAACMEAARIEGTLHGLAHRALASPAAAPAAERCPEPPPRLVETLEKVHGMGCGNIATQRIPAPPSEPVAPAPHNEVRVLVEPCEAGGHYRNERGVTFHPSKCRAALADGGER